MNLGLDGKVAIVTGAGRGIGRGIALVMGQEGATVAVNDIDAAVAQSVADEIKAAGGRAIAVKADVTSQGQVEAMVKRVTDEFGKVDVLVNNVGIVWIDDKPGTRNYFVDAPREEWDRDLNVILYSGLICSKAVIKQMVARRSGKIINIASASWRLGVDRSCLYAAGKGAVVSFTRTLAAEVGRHNVNVNCVSPGPMRGTRLAKAEQKPAAQAEKAKDQTMSLYDKMIGMCAMRRVGEPEEIGYAVAFLASDKSNFITGTVLEVDGGFPVLLRD